MDVETLYEMVSGAARNAVRMCSEPGGYGNGLPFQSYAGYPFYIAQYNRFLKLAVAEFPELSEVLSPINLGKAAQPASISGIDWKAYAELAALQLTSLADFLRTKLGVKAKEYDQIIDLIGRTLRPSLYEDPQSERDVQNALETIFRARALDFRREQSSVPFSTKRYIPDFTFDRIRLAVEVKLCKDQDRIPKMIDEINADIAGYAGQYERILFVVYDLGFIRDPARFSEDIESNNNAHVRVLVVKK